MTIQQGCHQEYNYTIRIKYQLAMQIYTNAEHFKFNHNVYEDNILFFHSSDFKKEVLERDSVYF